MVWIIYVGIPVDFHTLCLSKAINSILQAFHLTVLCWGRDNDKESKSGMEKDGQRKQHSSSGLGLLWSERGGSSVWECEGWVWVSMYVLGLEGDEKNQGQPPVPSLTLLGQTGILIRAGEYHCFIPPGKPNTHTHSHVPSLVHTKYREVEAQVMRRRAYMPMYIEQCWLNNKPPCYVQ